MQTPRRFHTAVPFHDHVYVFGGRCTSGSIATAESYDIRSNSWSPVPSMPEGRAYCAAVKTSKYIYVIGGEDDTWLSLSSVIRFDPASQQWSRVRSMKNARSFFPAIAIDDCRIDHTQCETLSIGCIIQYNKCFSSHCL